MAKRFTHAEAQRLLPEVGRLLRAALDAKAEFEEAGKAIQALNERVMLMGGVVVDHERALSGKSRRDAAAAMLKNAIEAIHETGCVVKDLDIGLVDFPTLFKGVEVYLCWKLGEPAIDYWHGIDEGFRGRKPIDKDFLENHRGDHGQ